MPDLVSEQPLLPSTTFEQIQWQSVITPEEFEFESNAASEHSLRLAVGLELGVEEATTNEPSAESFF